MEWYPLPQYYANGKLLGYTIYFRETSYWSAYQSVNTSSPYHTQVRLKDLKPGRQYVVRVAAFTSKGVGPWSYNYYATTGMHRGDNSLCMSPNVVLAKLSVFAREKVKREQLLTIWATCRVCFGPLRICIKGFDIHVKFQKYKFRECLVKEKNNGCWTKQGWK